jgi:hypothetical protein
MHDIPRYNENNLNSHRKSYGRYRRATEAESRPYAAVIAECGTSECGTAEVAVTAECGTSESGTADVAAIA